MRNLRFMLLERALKLIAFVTATLPDQEQSLQHSCLLSISASEEFAASNVLQDTFILWARKVLFALKGAGLLNAKQDDKIDYFKEKGITFHGKPVHKNLLSGLDVDW